MEVLMSNWPTDVQSLPESYIFPPNRRPGKHVFPLYEDIPTIDLEKARGNKRDEIIHQILEASQYFGFFQVINHGVSKGLMEETMNIYKEFFGMEAEYKASFFSNDINKSCRIYSSTLDYDNEEVHYWRDNFTHRCYPVQEHIQSWPNKPLRYREVIGEYCVELRKFLLTILNLIGEGLGVEEGYFEDKLTKTQLLSVNHHIPCPDPSLTLGMPEHCDPNLISMLHQCHVPGLQVFKDNQWLNVDPLPDSFLVITGLQLKVISNGMFTSPIHRVMTHSKEARTTIGMFLIPSNDILIEPAKAKAKAKAKAEAKGNGNSHPIYRPFTYKEFFTTFTQNKCNADLALQCFNNLNINTHEQHN